MKPKRIISTLLSLAMLISCIAVMPMTASAATYVSGEDGLKACVANGGTQTIILMETIYLDDWINVDSGNITIDLNGHFLDRRMEESESNGQVIKVESGATLNIRDSKGTGIITGGRNSGDGAGGVQIQDGSTFNMYGGTIYKCHSGKGGGGVHIRNGTFNMYGGVIQECDGDNAGGGVNIEDGSFYMYGGKLIQNQSDEGGGAIRMENDSSYFYMSSGEISSNTADNNGGAINIHNGKARIYGGKITGNTADDGHGGAIYVNDTFDDNTLIIQGDAQNPILITDNKCTGGAYDGGAIYINNGKVDIQYANFYRNSVPDIRTLEFPQGGAIYCNDADGTEISHCRFEENKAYDGGAIYIDTDNVKLDNITIMNNTSKNSGAIFADGNDFEISGKVIITQNSAKLIHETHSGIKGIYSDLFSINSNLILKSNLLPGSQIDFCVPVGSISDNKTIAECSNSAIAAYNAKYFYHKYGGLTTPPLQIQSKEAEIKVASELPDGWVPPADIFHDGHTLAYTASGNVLTEKCTETSNPDKCVLAAQTAKLTAPTSLVYNGSSHNAALTYTDGWQGDKNLSITYTKDGQSVSNTIDAGNYVASVTVGDATATVSYTVEKATASIGQAPTAVQGLVYNGEAQTLVTGGAAINGTIKYTLKNSGSATIWTSVAPKATDAGTHTVTYKAAGNENYNDSEAKTVEVTIAPKEYNETEIAIADIPSQNHTGEAIKPKPVIIYDSKTLLEGTDYTLSYKDNTAVGEATVNIAFKGNFSGNTSRAFTIEEAPAAENTYILNVTAPKFEAVSYGYTQPAAKKIGIENLGNATATIKDGAVSGDDAFVFDKESKTVQPKSGLSAGTYTATITVTYNEGKTATADVSFTVEKASQTPPEMGEGYTVDYKNETITVNDGYEVYYGANAKFESGASIADYLGTTVHIRKAAKENYNASGLTPITFAARPETPTEALFTKQEETMLNSKNASLSGVTEAYEYKFAEDEISEAEISEGAIAEVEWITGDNTPILNPNNKRIYVRVKATETAPKSAELAIDFTEGNGSTKITFDGNNGSGNMAEQTFDGSGGTLRANTFTREGYTFTGWNTEADGTGTSYDDAGYFIPTSTEPVTLYAQWWDLSKLLQLTGASVTGSGTDYEFSFEMSSLNEITGVFVIALYATDNRLVGVETIEMDTADTEYSVSKQSITTSGKATTYKVMFWDILDTLKPLCNFAGGNVKAE